MLRLALSFELRALRRSRAGAVALLAYLAAGALAISVGQGFVAEWEEALEAGETAQGESIAEARALWASTRAGVPSRSRVQLNQPRWQDRLAGTRVGREPGALAGVAAGSVDPAPVVFRVDRRADPLAAGGYRIENPELAGGAVDLVFVLSLLTPLLIAVLGLGIGGREREEHIDRLIVVQAGALRGWLVARSVAITLISAGAAGGLCMAAGLMGGASPGQTATLVGLAVLYTSVWGGLSLVVSAGAQTIRAGAFAFGALWTMTCVLLPAIAAEVGLQRVEADYGVAETLEARAVGYQAYEQEAAEVLDTVYRHFPELRALPAAADPRLAGQVRRHAFDGLMATAMLGRHESRLAQEERARALAETAAWLSPPLALTLALERLVGVGPEAASSYRSHLAAAVEDRVRWVLVQAWQKEDLDQADFEALVAEAPPAFRATPQGLALPSAILLAWLLAGWLLAATGLARGERQHAR